MLVGTIGLSLGPDILVKKGDGRFGQSFQTHSPIPFSIISNRQLGHACTDIRMQVSRHPYCGFWDTDSIFFPG
jgi:hypothetical protein